MFRSVILAAIFAVSVPTIASAFERISDRTTFVNTVGGQELKIAVYGLTLQVRPDGTRLIKGLGRTQLYGSGSRSDLRYVRDP